MRKGCCGQATCACKIEAGRMVDVGGAGTAEDPIVIDSTVSLDVEESETFLLTLFGNGDLDSPWMLRVQFADTASLDDFPDVNAPAPTDGYVLGWDSATSRWVPRPPTTAPPGSIVSGNSVQGDGSSGSPLEVKPDAARFITVTTAGVGLSDAGLNRLIRVFSTATARAAASPPPVEGTISVLQSNTSQLDYYNGSEWVPIGGTITVDAKPGQLLSLSGSYAGGKVVQYVAQLEVVTDPTGAFVIIPSEDLAEYAGVLSCNVQPVGIGPGWQCKLLPSGSVVGGVAYRLDTGGVYAGATLQAVVTALLY